MIKSILEMPTECSASRVAATILALLTFNGAGVFASNSDFNADTAAAAVALQHYYNKHGLWDTAGWWNAANCIEALENVIVVDNGGSYLPVLANTFKLNSGTNFLNEYYDDEGWWALAWIRAYDLTGKSEYLKASKTIFNDMTNGWTSHCDGGLLWRKGRHYKNAIPNELFLLVAARLHQRTPGDSGPGSYIDWVLKEWNWFRNTGMINPNNLVNDGLNAYCENNGRTTWTYNQGVIVGGLTELYRITGETNYLNQAMAIAEAAMTTLVDTNGVLTEPREEAGRASPDLSQFKGIFIRNLATLYDESHQPAQGDYLLRNARSIWANDRNSSNNLGLKWSGPFDCADAVRQSSAMFAVSALAEPMTQMLPFARGAGSLTFIHGVGGPSGTLAWTCNRNNAPLAGLMLSGTCASLAAGEHVAHFRMAVSEIKNSPAGLVSLMVKTPAAVLASRQISWSSFAAAEEQDFQLRFTNSTAGAPLEFQVHWENVTNAPGFTLDDLTIDGSHNWTAANLRHDLGQLDGLSGWEADPVRDRVSGCLTKGPGTDELPGGEYSASFELKVSNFNWDKSELATLSVVETDTGKVIASRSVKRNQFPNTLYQTFNLDFKADAGKRYDFRTWWRYAPNAPRLTQRSVVVRLKERQS